VFVGAVEGDEEGKIRVRWRGSFGWHASGRARTTSMFLETHSTTSTQQRIMGLIIQILGSI
jgi:hypothetical protein